MEDDLTTTAGPRFDPIKVTLSSASVYPRKVGYAFELAAELGYDGVEVMVWSDPATQDDDALANMAHHYGVEVRSIHAPTLLVSQKVWGARPGPKLAKAVDMAQTLGAGTVVVHPPFAWQRAYARQFVEQVHALTGASALTIAVENMYPWRSKRHEYTGYLPGWDPTELDYDAVTLDLSHAAVARRSSLEMAKSFGSRLRHVHLADGNGSNKDEHLVPGRGSQPCAEVLQHLAQTGWSGDIVVEIGTRKARTATERRDDIAAALTFARTYLSNDPDADFAVPQHPHRATDAW
jgi:sugar phosphate isomerase/epimerase